MGLGLTEQSRRERREKKIIVRAGLPGPLTDSVLSLISKARLALLSSPLQPAENQFGQARPGRGAQSCHERVLAICFSKIIIIQTDKYSNREMINIKIDPFVVWLFV